ncbi:hypothetical protein SBA4_4590019 [Candidatus Sulfopaludibacter sp. SbA4]|nr:hypothetical protein SBA4_4590019 [Candidatus Sulfopaludibacter sp. SbA4]
MVRDARSGKYRRTRLFVLMLGYSRKAVRLLVFQSSSQIWAELHEKAFRRLGGVTRTVARGGHRIKEEDRPNQAPLVTLQLLARADQAGSQIGALCRGMHRKEGEAAVHAHFRRGKCKGCAFCWGELGCRNIFFVRRGRR